MYFLRSLSISALFFLSMFSVRAQSNWEAGVRFGDGFALDATVPISMEPRLHAAAYFGGNFGLGAYFDWMFALDDAPEGLKFYPGVGPEVYFGNDFTVAVAGDFGAEYSFEFPLTVGLDWRPRLQFSENTGFYGGNWGLIARYRFGEGIHFRRASK
ncbi:MAG: hypothetical protein RL021_2048 [Bacteroidota bacterium]|jgi:hypothetical protein